MGARFKAIPLFAKLFVALLIVVTVYQFSHAIGASHRRTGSSSLPGFDRQGSEDVASDTAEQRVEANANQALAQFKAQQQQLMSRVYQCEAEMNQATQQMAQAAINGQMMNNRPQCEQYMPQWTAQEAYLETEIYRIQTGDHRSSVREITGITGPTPDRPGTTSDGGTNAVENWDRQAIRGNSLYVDESGQQHELPTRNYYFRDRASGQIIGSDSPNPPNDGRDYEVFTGQQ
jgi:hypothetical protein